MRSAARPLISALAVAVFPGIVMAQTTLKSGDYEFVCGGQYESTRAYVRCPDRMELVQGETRIFAQSGEWFMDEGRATFDQVRQFLGGVLSDPESGIGDLSRFEMQLWVTEGTNSLAGGLPVRLRADMAGKDASGRDFTVKIEMDVTNINDGGLNVIAPR